MSQTQEFIVRMPREVKKQFNVMKFGESLNVDVSRWKSTKMERENNQKELSIKESESQKFGAGSEFGKQQKEDARRKKYGSHAKKYNANDQPWMLKVGGKHGKKYKGIREGGVSENASYYLFFQAPDGVFEAFPVKEWYNFTPIQRYKALTAEEAEEKFEKRDKILNFFSVMLKKRNDDDANEPKRETKAKVKKEFKVTDMDEWNNDDSENDDRDERSDDDDDDKRKVKNKKLKGKNKPKKKKKKGSDDDDDDSEPLEESDEGDFDDKEVDYMSSSSSEDESENEKTNREMKGVEDEDALRQLDMSDDEEEEQNADANEKEKSAISDKPENTENDAKVKVKVEKDTGNFDSPPPSSSDSDDSDLDKSKSALFMPKKNSKSGNKNASDHSANSSRAATPTTSSQSSAGHSKNSESNKLKRKNANDIPPAKKSKLSNDLNADGITEDVVRRYLMRKPMTTAELLQKFKNKVQSKTDLMTIMTMILKKLNPEKQTIKGKLYLSLRPS